MPDWFNPSSWPANWNIAWDMALSGTLTALAAIGGGYLLYRLILAAMRRLAAMSETALDDLMVERVARPLKWAVIVLGLTIAAQADQGLLLAWEPMARFLRPAILGWIAYSLVKALTAAFELRFDASEDPVAMRSRRTRLAILSRSATLVIVTVTVGLMLMAIPGVRSIGTTLLASAGLAALAVGAAAQPALKSFISGLQMAMTEPIRIGDMVKVDGYTGRVEEIRMTFVLIRSWDERLIAVPTGRFFEQSFENWSRKNERLTGPVFLHLDPATPVAPIREEFQRFVSAHPLWDQRTADALLTEAYPESIEVRLAVSARTIGDLWQLRCELREHMLEWLRDNMPDSLIRHRLEVDAANARAKSD
ncbi:MAG: mechanosensitive ion channel protein MscS [Sphingomonadales bacterium BRH_c42]|nr:MAG: mechanosensitive ion channel protein MscS [Sphingomonadales bacterium BRH_c42]